MDMALINDNLLNVNEYDYKIAFNYNLLNRFIAYTDVEDTTIKGYATYIRQFIKYLIEHNIKHPTRDDIKAYKEHLKDTKLTTGTKMQYFRAVKHLFKWLASEGLYPNVADNIKGFKVKNDNTKKESFNEEDIKTIINNIDTSTEIGKRNKCIMLVALTGGLRISEMVNIDIQDIQMIKGQYVVYIQGKGHTEKDTYKKIIDPVYQAIQEYLSVKNNVKKTDALFTSTSNRALNKRITKESLSSIIKECFKKAGYDTPKLTAHSLRHTSNTMLFKSGADIYKVQQHARHQDPKTTEIYLHAVEQESDTSEQDIYNQIFNTEAQNITNELKNKISTLSLEQQEQILKYIDTLKGGSNM